MEFEEDLPIGIGSYTIREAALYIGATVRSEPSFPRVNSRHLSCWIRQGLAHGKHGGTPYNRFINFYELVSFRIVAMLRSRKFPAKTIQAAHNRLQDRFGWEYPFAMQPLWVAHPDVFIELDEFPEAVADLQEVPELQRSPVAVTHHFQSAFNFKWGYLEPVGSARHGLIFDTHEKAISWEPYPDVVLDPGLQFGVPCIKGTRIPTETIWAFNQGGDSPATLAYLYDVPFEAINRALEWEGKLADAAANRRTSKVPA